MTWAVIVVCALVVMVVGWSCLKVGSDADDRMRGFDDERLD